MRSVSGPTSKVLLSTPPMISRRAAARPFVGGISGVQAFNCERTGKDE